MVPQFVRANGVPITRAYFTERLGSLLSDAGIAGRYSSYSFRIDAATSAGVLQNMIQTLGRWTSSAYLTYIRAPRSLLSEFIKSYVTVDSNLSFYLLSRVMLPSLASLANPWVLGCGQLLEISAHDNSSTTCNQKTTALPFRDV